MDAGKVPRELVEGVDYYVEAGRWVFTAAYHRARGSCCASGCRHCPWGYAKPSAPPQPLGQPLVHPSGQSAGPPASS